MSARNTASKNIKAIPMPCAYLLPSDNLAAIARFLVMAGLRPGRMSLFRANSVRNRTKDFNGQSLAGNGEFFDSWAGGISVSSLMLI